MDDERKKFAKIMKRLKKARKHNAKGKVGAVDRVRLWEKRLDGYYLTYGKSNPDDV
ncbi:hypothetical protein SAMN05414139_10272 [Burkholderia sp. D7]|nr:hypothetical protein SAMN05414139_10272 [Burkholderia sp. D7]